MDDGPARFEPAPPRDRAGAQPEAGPAHLADPRAITILTTEHWSLLTTRSLVYNESFSRGAMFLTFLSASLVALGFVAGSGETGTMLPLIAVALLALDLFIGLATLGRLVAAGSEEMRALQGMARLRHAYLEMVPDLDPYFTTPRHDDLTSILSAYGASQDRPTAAQNILHGFTTMPGMIGTVDSAVAAALVGMIAIAIGVAPVPAFLIGLVAGIAFLSTLAIGAAPWYLRQSRILPIGFPAPTAPIAQEATRRT